MKEKNFRTQRAILFIAAMLFGAAACVFAVGQVQNVQVIGAPVAGDQITVRFEAMADIDGNTLSTDIVFSTDAVRAFDDDAVLTSLGAYGAGVSMTVNDGHTGYDVMTPVSNSVFTTIDIIVMIPSSYLGSYYVYVAVRETDPLSLNPVDISDAVAAATMDVITPSMTPTVTPTVTATVTPTVTPTVTATVTATVTPTVTQTVTATVTPTVTATVTPTVTPTVTTTITQTITATVTPTVTATVTQSITQTASPTVTETSMNTATNTPTVTPTVTGTVTQTVTPTVTVTVTKTVTPTVTVTVTKTVTPTVTVTVTKTITPTVSATVTKTVTPSVTTTDTPVNTFTGTATGTYTYSPTETGTKTHSPTRTITRTNTPSPTITPTGSVLPTPAAGEGSAVIAPASVLASGTGNIIVIDYTVGATSWAQSPGYGTLVLTIPAGWTAPSDTEGQAGYIYITASAGTYTGSMILGNDVQIWAEGLSAGNVIRIIYGDRTGGGPGVTAQPGTGTVEFTIKSCTSGTGVSSIADSPDIIVALATATATPTITQTWTATPNSTPVKPSGFSTTQSGNNTTLSWNTAPLVDYYRVYRVTGAAGKFSAFPSAWTIIATVLPTPAITSYTDTNTFNYAYYLAAGVNGAGEGKPGPLSEKLNLSFAFAPGGINTYRISLPYISSFTKASDIATAIEGSLFSTPSKIDKLALWNPATQSFSLFGWQAGVGAWIGTDWLIDAGTMSSNAVYVHSISVFTWPFSGVSKSQGLYFKYNTTKANANKRSIPYSSNYSKASDVVIDIEGGTGPGTNTKINRLAVWNPATQSYTALGYSPATGWGVGTDFTINPGDAINIYPSGNTSEFTWTPKISITPAP